MMKAVETYRGEGEPQDDRTVVVVTYPPTLDGESDAAVRTLEPRRSSAMSTIVSSWRSLMSAVGGVDAAAQLDAGVDLGAGADDGAGVQNRVAADGDAVAEDGAEFALAGRQAFAVCRPGSAICFPSWRKLERMTPAPRLTSLPRIESPT